MSLREAAQAALEWIRNEGIEWIGNGEEVKQALRAALAESAEPVAWCKPCPPDHAEDKRVYLAQDYDFSGGYGVRKETALSHGWIPLYTHPPAREAELSDEEVIGEYGWQGTSRQWWTGGAWLEPDDVVIVRRAAARGKG